MNERLINMNKVASWYLKIPSIILYYACSKGIIEKLWEKFKNMNHTIICELLNFNNETYADDTQVYEICYCFGSLTKQKFRQQMKNLNTSWYKIPPNVKKPLIKELDHFWGKTDGTNKLTTLSNCSTLFFYDRLHCLFRIQTIFEDLLTKSSRLTSFGDFFTN